VGSSAFASSFTYEGLSGLKGMGSCLAPISLSRRPSRSFSGSFRLLRSMTARGLISCLSLGMSRSFILWSAALRNRRRHATVRPSCVVAAKVSEVGNGFKMDVSGI